MAHQSAETEAAPPFELIVAITHKAMLWPLLSVAYALARSTPNSHLTILVVSETGEVPDWFLLPTVYDNKLVNLDVEALKNSHWSPAILRYTQQQKPDLLLLAWLKRKGGEGLSQDLDLILKQAPCNVALLKADSEWPESELNKLPTLSVLVPAAGGPNAPLALDLAFNLSSNVEVTSLYVGHEGLDDADFLSHQEQLAEMTQAWRDNGRLRLKVIRASSPLKGILSEAADCDITMLGASQEDPFSKFIFGRIPQKIAQENPKVTLIVRQFDGSIGSSLRRLWWRATHILPSLTLDERSETYKQIRRGARPKIDFFVMIALAAGIAAFGLMLNSPAVIIGAMLVAPLMAAIMGMGMGIIQADARLLRLASNATLRGVILAILMGFLVGLIMPTPNLIPSEIDGRTRASILDLGVALISGLAGAYALCRRDVSASLPGVAIAAALVPPLTVVGIGLAWRQLAVASGALLLFSTNLIAITAASALIFFILGFRPSLRAHGSGRILRSGLLSSVILLILITSVLGRFSYQSYVQTKHKQQIEACLYFAVAQLPQKEVILDSWQTEEYSKDHLNITLNLRSPDNLGEEEAQAIKGILTHTLNQSITLQMSVIPSILLGEMPSSSRSQSCEGGEFLPQGILESSPIATPNPEQ